jgi:curved DNA-binding protein CbpA
VNHFEELGLERSAGPDQIRQAYRTLAFLLHPDRQRSEQHRKLADLQMKRLNAAIETLLDPARRRAYESELDYPLGRPTAARIIVVPAAPAEPQSWRGGIDTRSILLFAAGAVFATLLWYTVDSTRTSDAAQFALPRDTAEATLRSQLAEMEERVQSLEQQRMAPATRAEASGRSNRLAGAWYYDLSATTGPNRALASKRIEMNIADESGALHGTYRSQGNPLANQPEDAISFDFNGKVDSSPARLPWTTSDGGSGEIELRLIGRDTLETRWWAFSMGKSPHENHGSAVLRRRTVAAVAP